MLAQNKSATATAATTTAAITNGDAAAAAAALPPKKDETEFDDDPSLPIPDNATCRRRGCNAQYTSPRDIKGEKCVYHPGQPIFHEGSKGWSCCKRRVLEFDQFLKIEGCKEREGHQFVGRKKEEGEEELLDEVRYVNFFSNSQSSYNGLANWGNFSDPTSTRQKQPSHSHSTSKTSIAIQRPLPSRTRHPWPLTSPLPITSGSSRQCRSSLQLTWRSASGRS